MKLVMLSILVLNSIGLAIRTSDWEKFKSTTVEEARSYKDQAFNDCTGELREAIQATLRTNSLYKQYKDFSVAKIRYLDEDRVFQVTLEKTSIKRSKSIKEVSTVFLSDVEYPMGPKVSLTYRTKEEGSEVIYSLERVATEPEQFMLYREVIGGEPHRVALFPDKKGDERFLATKVNGFEAISDYIPNMPTKDGEVNLKKAIEDNGFSYGFHHFGSPKQVPLFGFKKITKVSKLPSEDSDAIDPVLRHAPLTSIPRIHTKDFNKKDSAKEVDLNSFWHCTHKQIDAYMKKIITPTSTSDDDDSVASDDLTSDGVPVYSRPAGKRAK